MPADLSIEDGVGIHELTLTVVGAGVPSGLPLRKWVLATVEFLPAYCIKFLNPPHVLLNLGATTPLLLSISNELVYTMNNEQLTPGKMKHVYYER